LAKLRADDQILFQYATETGDLTDEANPNGSLLNIAGICNKGRNVCGMMPHPERASENVLGADDGRRVFESMLRHLEAKTGVGEAATAEV
jgi:phosphoribosylformylglycinamidine synthase